MTESKWGFVLPFACRLSSMWCSVDDTAHVTPSIAIYAYMSEPADGAEEGATERLGRVRNHLEALELLALVALVDADGWVAILRNVVNPRIMAPNLSLHRAADGNGTVANVLPLHVLNVSRNEGGEQWEDLLAAVYTPLHDVQRSEAFECAKRKLLDMAESQSVRDACESLQLPVVLSVRERVAEHQAITWFHENKRHGPTRCKVVSIEVMHYGGRVSGGLVDSIHRQVTTAEPIPLGNISFGIFSFTPGTTTRRQMGQFMVDLLGSAYGANSIDCRNFGTQVDASQSFLSQLLVPPSSDRLESLRLLNLPFGGTQAQNRCHLLWLLYGLFSHKARHRIRCLELIVSDHAVGPLFRWAAELLRVHGVPRSELLIEEVFDEFVHLDPPTEERYVVVPCGHSIRLALRGDEDNTLTFSDCEMEFQVLRDDRTSDFLDILVPGYGHCWVERSDAIKVQSKALIPWSFHQHSIETMKLGVSEINDQEKDSVCSVLALVGEPVTALYLVRWMSRDSGSPGNLDLPFLSAMACSCPRLDTLSLGSVLLVNADVLIQVYEEEVCHMKLLQLMAGAFADKMDMVHLADALGDPSTAISHTLQCLSVEIGDHADEAAALALLAMLATNRQLRSVQIGLSIEHWSLYGSLFQEYHNKPIAVKKAPLAMESKCALLSGASVATALDRPVVANVLAFAAVCETRVVTVYVLPSTNNG